MPPKDFFFDGQRWMRRSQGSAAPAQRGPRAPEEFSIGDDDSDFEDDGGREVAKQRGGDLVLGAARMRNWAAALTLALVLLFVVAQFTLLAPLLPAEGGASSQGGFLPQQASPEGLQGRSQLVQWHGLKPECVGSLYRVAAGHPAKVREGADKESRALAVLRPGDVVRRTGPCENQAGLVRMPLAFAGNSTATGGNGTVMGGRGPPAGGGELLGWATLTAEFVQGPRFFEPADAGTGV